MRVLAALWQRRGITDGHARVLRLYGGRQKAPDLARGAEAHDYQTWTDAMTAMDWALRVKGIVA